MRTTWCKHDRAWRRAGQAVGLLVALAAVGALGCGGEAPQGQGERAPAAVTCPAGTVKGLTTQWVFARSAPNTASVKTLLAAGSEVCVLLDDDGEPETVTGSSYATFEGYKRVGSDNRWYRIDRSGATNYIAAYYVKLLAGNVVPGSRAVLYIQALPDAVLSAKMAARADVTVAIDEASKQELATTYGYWVPREVFLGYVEQALESVLQQADEITVVISGHSTGPSLWGDYGEIGHEDLAALAKRYPAFAARVRHLFLLGCNTGWRPTMESWELPFPNLISISGFAGAGPGAMPAYRYFDQSYEVVRDLAAPVSAPAAVVATLSSQSQAVWCNWAFLVNGASGTAYDALKNEDLYAARLAYRQTEELYRDSWLAADGAAYADPPSDTHAEVVDGQFTPRKHYNNVQGYRNALAQALAAGSSETWWNEDDTRLQQLEQEMAQAIRLVFFRMCKDAWLEDSANVDELDKFLNRVTYRSYLRAAYNAAISELNPATQPLDVGTVTRQMLKQMTRMETNALVAELESRLPSWAVFGRGVTKRLRAALVELNSSEIPSAYIE